MDQQVVSAHEYLRQQGQSFIVLHPTEHLLYLGFGCEDIPRVVPHCVAENTATAAAEDAAGPRNSSSCTWAPDEQAYEALAEVWRVELPSSADQQCQGVVFCLAACRLHVLHCYIAAALSCKCRRV
jgi:hypothetical protein